MIKVVDEPKLENGKTERIIIELLYQEIETVSFGWILRNPLYSQISSSIYMRKRPSTDGINQSLSCRLLQLPEMGSFPKVASFRGNFSQGSLPEA